MKSRAGKQLDWQIVWRCKPNKIHREEDGEMDLDSVVATFRNALGQLRADVDALTARPAAAGDPADPALVEQVSGLAARVEALETGMDSLRQSVTDIASALSASGEAAGQAADPAPAAVTEQPAAG